MVWVLTKFDIYVILSKDFGFSEGQAQKIMEVYADFFRTGTLLHNKFNRTCEKKMDNLNINLEQSVNYLVQLFYQTEQKFSCSRTKIGKLLSIIAFVYARRNIKAFNEAIYRYVYSSDDTEGCGTTIKELNIIVDRDIYIPYDCMDNNGVIKETEINNNVEIPQRFQNIELIKTETQSVIRDVFMNFGSYKAQTLGKCINPIILIRNAYSADNQIDLEIIKSLSKSDFNQTLTNRNVIEYLFH